MEFDSDSSKDPTIVPSDDNIYLLKTRFIDKLPEPNPLIPYSFKEFKVRCIYNQGYPIEIKI